MNYGNMQRAHELYMEDPELFAPFGITPSVPFAADFSIGVNWGDQYDIAYDEEKWSVSCSACGAVRTEETKPKNRRCEECGSRKVQRNILTGPLKPILHQLYTEHGFAEL